MRDFSMLFDGSFEGFLCVIYAHYYQKLSPAHIQEASEYQRALDAEEFYVATDAEKAARVFGGVREKISPDAAHYLYNAFLNGEADKYMDMFRYARLGFKVGAAVDSHLQEDFVLRVHRLAKRVGSEAHLLSGFCRFTETKQGVFYCPIKPVNHVLPILAEHFSDRLMNQAWIIHDKGRHMAAVYNGQEYFIGPAPDSANLSRADDEEIIQDLWRLYFSTIGIKERTSYKGQRQHIPLYFRGVMTEFQKKLLD